MRSCVILTHLLHHAAQRPANWQGLVGLADAPVGVPPPAQLRNGPAAQRENQRNTGWWLSPTPLKNYESQMG